MTGNAEAPPPQKSASRRFDGIGCGHSFLGDGQQKLLLQITGPCGKSLVQREFQVCRKCAVRYAPLCANMGFFDTSCECFRAGLGQSKLLIYK